MQVIRWFFIAVFMLLILGFALYNQEQQVSVRFLRWQSANLPLYLLLYIAYGAGVLTWVVVSSLNLIARNRVIARLRKEKRKVQEELDRLRNASLDEEEVIRPDSDRNSGTDPEPPSSDLRGQESE